MHPHSDGGYEQEPGLVEFAQYVEPATNSDYTNLISAQVGTPDSFMYHRGGTKLYVLESGILYQYSCSTAFGPPTSYDSKTLDLTGTDSAPVAVIWRDDSDDAFFMLGANGGAYYSFLGSDSDITTYSYAAISVTVPSISGTLRDFFTLDGQNWLFSTSSKCYHHTSSIWEAALTKQSESPISDFASFNSDGTLFYRLGGSQYRTPTAFDVSALYSVDAGSLLATGFPGGIGTTTSVIYKLINGNMVSVGEKSIAGAFYASWSTTDDQIVSDGDFRGGGVMNGVPYLVFGNSVLSFDSSGTWSAFANSTPVAGSGTIVADTDGTNLVLVTGAKQYRFRLTDGLTEINDSDINGCVSTSYLDSTFYYAIAGRVYSSDLADPTTIGSLNFLTAESFTDDVVRNFTLNQLHYAFGTETTEIYYTSGVGNTRLSRQKVLEHGLIGTYAIDSIDDTIYFVDEQRRLSRIRGLEYAPIKVKGLGPEFESYSTVSDCIVNAFSFEQENFIDITFPTQDVTWRIHEDSGEVVKAEDTSGNRVRAAAYLNVYGDTYAVDRSNGKVYLFSASTYQDDGSAITRTLYSPNVTSETLGSSDRRFVLNVMYLEYETSASSDIGVSISKDSGATFGTARTITANGRGITRLSSWGMATDVIVKIETNANAKVDILGLSVEVEFLDD